MTPALLRRNWPLTPAMNPTEGSHEHRSAAARPLRATRGPEPSSRRGSLVFVVSKSGGAQGHPPFKVRPQLGLPGPGHAGHRLPACPASPPWGISALLCVFSCHLLSASSPQNSHLHLISPYASPALSNSFHHLQLFEQDSSHVVSRFLQDSYCTTFTGFSRVTNLFRGDLQPHLDGASSEPLPASEYAPHLGCSWEGSARERKTHVRKKTDEDFHLKLPWKSVRPGQGRRNSPPHEYRSLMARDESESRSHRTNKFFEGRENPGLGLLNDILLPDCLYHDELGYVQGRSDLLFPIRYGSQDEVDAFLCFWGVTEFVLRNSEEIMKRQLLLLLKVLDPPL
ncbi:hypothetical protein J1605_019013 [Eschrichtius robustus]|uniref:Rab-GAP TBC domain-containing protein n=1 Tax=Eschrichtius robustus TaxID=9764 RepID=A0AB34HNJ2_ESCRO|nr:hypothetical protein J1605_019013 [Eschrichtius robustus]